MADTNNGGLYGSIVNDAFKLCVKKHKDYGPTNIDGAGILGILVRLGDKMARFRTIASSAGVTLDDSPEVARMKILAATNVKDKFEDDLLDLVNYGVIAIMWLIGAWGDDAEFMFGSGFHKGDSSEDA